jgi:protein transport protein YIF1
VDSTGELHRPPRDDDNAPDMYIPAMAFVTYMLLVGVALGQRHAFTPEVLGLTASKAAAVVLAEVAIVKGVCWALPVPGEVKWLDLVAYMGYKFVGYAQAPSLSLPLSRRTHV